MRYEMTKDLETGNALIDSEHRQLFKAVNDLLDAVPREKDEARWSPPWISLCPMWPSILGMRKSFRCRPHIPVMLPTGSSMNGIKVNWP